ncbi:MAG: DNA adenine methylase [Spirochaetia bacterium]
MDHCECQNYLQDQLITYIGNKRALLALIDRGVALVKKKLSKDSLVTLDMFSGSGIVARFLKRYSTCLIANDLEDYAHIINACYLANKNEIDWALLESWHTQILDHLDHSPPVPGFLTKLYAPKDEENIQPGERVFYTRANAIYLDMARTAIAQMPTDLQPFLLAPLLSQASIHTNTAGVFKGFYKNKAGIGQFGGHAQHALSRIKGQIELQLPVLSNFNCQTTIFQKDANLLVHVLPDVDIAYLDPPYNQHPYGSNYFMLNLLANYEEPHDISRISGIPAHWHRSAYNKKTNALEAMHQLCENLPARFILISFNSEGFISKEGMLDMLSSLGKVEILEQDYPTFRGSRNLRERAICLQEYLYILEKPQHSAA